MHVRGLLASVALAVAASARAAAGPAPTLAELGESLARDAALLDAPHERPLHRGAPEPGATGDALAAHLPPFEAEVRAHGDARSALAPWKAIALAGAGPGDRERAALVRLGPDLDALLASTRHVRAELPPDAEAMAPAHGATWVGYQLAVAMAGARGRAALQRGDARAATADCLDGLALARDAAISGGLIGSMNAAASIDTLAPGCVAALAASPDAARREAGAAVRAIRAALPSVAAVFRVEALEMELMVFGHTAGSALWKRVGPRARAWIDSDGASPAPASASERERQRARWARCRAAWDALVRAGALAPPERASALERVHQLLADRPEDAREGGPYERYALRIERMGERLDAVASGAAARP